MKMLIGSTAAKHWFPDFKREPKDIDFISENKIEGTDSKFCSSFKFLLEKYPNQEIAPPNVLYTLKVSHSFWDGVWWDKTMYDIRFFQSKNVPIDNELFYELYRDCEQRYGKKKAYLNKPNDDFFKDGVKRKYIHDQIHEAVAYYERPLYESIKNDKDKALTSEELFWKLSAGDRIKLCLEELHVTALERFLIPSNFEKYPRSAFWQAYKSLVTSMTKGWFAKFLVENCLRINSKPYFDYVTKFKERESGLIKL